MEDLLVFLLFLIIVTVLYFVQRKNKDFFLLSVLLGVVIIFINSFIYVLPEADGDAIYYVQQAQYFWEYGIKPSDIDIFSSRGYSLIIATVLGWANISSFTVGLFNLTLSCFTFSIVNKILTGLVDRQIARFGLLLLTLSPMQVLYSAIPLRESLFSFLIVVSCIPLFSKQQFNILSWALGLTALIFAIVIHKMAIFVFIGYLVRMLLVANVLPDSPRALLVLILIISATLFEVLGGFFSFLVETQVILYRVAESSRSVLNYPSWLIGSEIGLIKWIILPIFFLFSPFIFSLSKLTHLVLWLDSILFMYLVFISFKIKYLKSFEKAVLISLVMAFLIIAQVSVNSGTSTRHRNKFFEIVLIVAMTQLQKKNTKLRVDKLRNKK